MAPSFAASSDFAISKAAGQRCRNLADDFGCAIHAQLRERGFPGCTVYDCFGAGQHVTQVTLGGRTWRQSPDLAGTMFTAFEVVRALHETLWYLTEALELPEAKPLAQQLHQAYEATLRHTLLDPQALGDLDLRSHRDAVAKLLGRTSALARSGQPAEDRSLRGADLVGRGFAGMDLRGADFRGALLLGADLRDTDLRRADLFGAGPQGCRPPGRRPEHQPLPHPAPGQRRSRQCRHSAPRGAAAAGALGWPLRSGRLRPGRP